MFISFCPHKMSPVCQELNQAPHQSHLAKAGYSRATNDKTRLNFKPFNFDCYYKMNNFLKIGIWNANGLAHAGMQQLLRLHQKELMVISETRFASKNYFMITGYKTLIFTSFTMGKTSPILTTTNVIHHRQPNFLRDYFQKGTISVYE